MKNTRSLVLIVIPPLIIQQIKKIIYGNSNIFYDLIKKNSNDSRNHVLCSKIFFYVLFFVFIFGKDVTNDP